MHGNVWEWCDDAVKAEDGAPPGVCRGGGWRYGSGDCWASFRHKNAPSDRHDSIGLRLARVPSGAPAAEAKTPRTVAPFTDADVQRIAALPVSELVEEVRKELMRRNPDFDGKVEHKIEDGVVTEIKVVTENVTEISPLRVFNSLRVLDCAGTAFQTETGRLSDLTPLKGMNLAGLTHLGLHWTQVGDAGLAHFKDCKKLTRLHIEKTEITDLSLLKGMPLKELDCDFQPERDAEILRSITTLETINGKPAAEFWKEVEQK